MAGRWVKRVVAVVLALAVMAGFSPLTSPARATTAGPAVGMVTDLTWGISRADMERTVNLLSASGVRWVRLNVSWSGVERDGKGVINTGWLAEIDAAVRLARAAGLQVLMPIADGVPYWASADPAKGSGWWNKYWKPASMADYADFVRFVTNRYSPLGVTHYEIWNEPNHPHFWPSGVNAADYLPMLKAGYQAVKAANPAAVVLMGGLSKGDHYYLQQLYAAGAKPYMDVVNIHPYSGAVAPTQCWTDGNGRKAVDAFCSIEEVRNVMVANGDSGRAMWLTEFGWTTYSGTWGVTEAQQAQYLTDAFTWLGSRTYVTHAFWYAFRNTYWHHDDPSEWEGNVGLLRTDFTAKPAHKALTTLTAQATTTTTAPTTTTPPTTTTTAPATTTTAPATTTTTAPATTTTAPATTTTTAPATTTTTTTTPSTKSMRMDALVGTWARSGKGWVARATASVVDDRGAALAGVRVSGTWTAGGTGSCTTGSDGRCTVSTQRLRSTTTTTTYRTEAAVLEGYSTGTTPLLQVTVSRS